MNRMITGTVALFASIALVIGASPPTPSTAISADQSIDGVSLVDAIDTEMTHAGWERTVEYVNGEAFVTFVEPNGVGEFTLPHSYSPTNGTAQPHIGVGAKDGRLAISFNQTDQTALLGGGQALIVAAICAVGTVACTVAGVVAAFASSYLSEVGRCPGNDELWVYFRPNGPTPGVSITGAECVPVSFPGGG